VVGGGHGDTAHPEAGEGGMVVEEGVVLGVGVDEVEGGGVVGAAGFDVAEEAAEEGELEGVEEEGEGGFGRERVEGGVGVVKLDGSEGVGGGVLRPEVDVGLGDGGEVGVELDAFDARRMARPLPAPTSRKTVRSMGDLGWACWSQWSMRPVRMLGATP